MVVRWLILVVLILTASTPVEAVTTKNPAGEAVRFRIEAVGFHTQALGWTIRVWGPWVRIDQSVNQLTLSELRGRTAQISENNEHSQEGMLSLVRKVIALLKGCLVPRRDELPRITETNL